MPSPLLPFLRFHAQRLLREHPIASFVLATCIIFATVAAAVLVSQTRRAAAAKSELATLTAGFSAPRVTGLHSYARPLVPQLPKFQSSELVTVLNETAAESDLILDEVTYSLDDNVRQPYLRYRITMTLHASYPLIRRLAEQLSVKVPHLTLDAIDCSRKDVVVAELSCDMTMSGFFSRGRHG